MKRNIRTIGLFTLGTLVSFGIGAEESGRVQAPETAQGDLESGKGAVDKGHGPGISEFERPELSEKYFKEMLSPDDPALMDLYEDPSCQPEGATTTLSPKLHESKLLNQPIVVAPSKGADGSVQLFIAQPNWEFMPSPKGRGSDSRVYRLKGSAIMKRIIVKNPPAQFILMADDKIVEYVRIEADGKVSRQATKFDGIATEPVTIGTKNRTFVEGISSGTNSVQIESTYFGAQKSILMLQAMCKTWPNRIFKRTKGKAWK